MFSACYWEFLQEVGIFRCIWIYGNVAKSVRAWNQIKRKYWVMVWQWRMLCSERDYLKSVGGRQAGRPCLTWFGFTAKNYNFICGNDVPFLFHLIRTSDFEISAQPKHNSECINLKCLDLVSAEHFSFNCILLPFCLIETFARVSLWIDIIFQWHRKDRSVIGQLITGFLASQDNSWNKIQITTFKQDIKFDWIETQY